MTPVAITVAQPFASLLAHGIAEWHTSRARPQLKPGQEVWVVSGRQWAKGWLRWYNPDDADDAARMDLFERLGVMMSEDPGGSYSYYPWKPDLPLSAVLSRHRLAEVVPIVDVAEYHGTTVYLNQHDDTRAPLWLRSHCQWRDITDQIPYSDWSPGRWAWRLELIERLETPVREYPCGLCRGHSEVFVDDAADGGRWIKCDRCTRGNVPVRGRPGIWRPDPALIAAVRGEGSHG